MSAPKVLVIDDNALVIITTKLMLEKYGYAVLTASNGPQGLLQLGKDRPDVILLDIMMPGMDGWEVLACLRQNPELISIPVIVFTAADEYAKESTAFARGAVGILRKPFHLHQILEELQKAIPSKDAS